MAVADQLLDGSRFLDGDYEDLVERFYEERWTDGLPVVIPTPKLVDRMIDASGRDRFDVLGEIGPRGGIASIEAIAINAVMGGCKPEYMPVVLAALEAALAPEHNLTGVLCTTHGSAPLTIVNGPQVKRLGFNAADGVFGSGYRANAAVGRALSLTFWSLGGARPGETDKSTMSQPGEYTFCIAEDEENSPWEPLHVERGLPVGSDAVTVFACEAPQSIEGSADADHLLLMVVGHLLGRGSNNLEMAGYGEGQTLLVFNSLQAQRLAEEGWTKADLKRAIWERARFTVGERLREWEGVYSAREGAIKSIAERGSPWVDWSNPAALVPVVPTPEDIHVVVAGGRTYFAANCPGWGPFGGYAVTRPVRPSAHRNSSERN